MSKAKEPITFTVGEVAKMFGKSVHWVHWREREGHFQYPDGSQIKPKRGGEGDVQKSRRLYTPEEVENMAFSLARRGSLSYEESQRVEAIVRNYPKV